MRVPLSCSVSLAQQAASVVLAADVPLIPPSATASPSITRSNYPKPVTPSNDFPMIYAVIAAGGGIGLTAILVGFCLLRARARTREIKRKVRPPSCCLTHARA